MWILNGFHDGNRLNHPSVAKESENNNNEKMKGSKDEAYNQQEVLFFFFPLNLKKSDSLTHAFQMMFSQAIGQSNIVKNREEY